MVDLTRDSYAWLQMSESQLLAAKKARYLKVATDRPIDKSLANTERFSNTRHIAIADDQTILDTAVLKSQPRQNEPEITIIERQKRDPLGQIEGLSTRDTYEKDVTGATKHLSQSWKRYEDGVRVDVGDTPQPEFTAAFDQELNTIMARSSIVGRGLAAFGVTRDAITVPAVTKPNKLVIQAKR